MTTEKLDNGINKRIAMQIKIFKNRQTSKRENACATATTNDNKKTCNHEELEQ